MPAAKSLGASFAAFFFLASLPVFVDRILVK